MLSGLSGILIVQVGGHYYKNSCTKIDKNKNQHKATQIVKRAFYILLHN